MSPFEKALETFSVVTSSLNTIQGTDLGLQQCANTQTKRKPAEHVQLLNFNSITYCGMYDH